MDAPKVILDFAPEACAMRQLPGRRAQAPAVRGVHFLGRQAQLAGRDAADKPQAAGRGAFPVDIVDNIRSYIAGNAIKQDIAYLFGKQAVWGKDCITLHNGLIRDVFLKKPKKALGDRIIGKGSTHAIMFKSGEASALKSFGFLTDKGRPAAGNADACALKDSVGGYIRRDYRGAGVQIYGVSINDGYHALTLTYGENGKGGREYHLIDNGPAASFITGHRLLRTARELDRALNEYERRNSVRSYRVGKNKDQTMPARLDVYEIYPPRGR
jgi:hypothetical protein